MKPAISTYDHILDVAQTLVIAGGYNGFSYADIADAIGIRKASIHYHFPAKGDLVALLVTRYRTQAESGLASLAQHVPDPFDQLQAYAAYWQACIRDRSAAFCVCAMLASEMPLLPEAVASGVRAHFDTLRGWLTSVLKTGVEQGLFRLDRPAEDEAEVLMASVHGAMLSARVFDDPALFGAIVTPQIERLRIVGSPRV